VDEFLKLIDHRLKQIKADIRKLEKARKALTS
jgi:hypothetical protein